MARFPLRLLLAVLLTFAGAGCAQEDLHDELLAATNAARAEHGLAPLAPDRGLARAAAGHARELAERGVLTHASTDPSRRRPADRVARAGVELVEVGENLAAMSGADVVERTVAGWLDSPGHRRNLLNGAYTHVGHAVARAGRIRWIVQVLGARPLERREAGVRVDAAGTATLRLVYATPDAPLALFVDGRHRPAANVAPGELRLELPLPDAPLRVRVGLDAGDGSARIVERFELRPGPPPALVPGAPAGDAEAT